MKKMLFCIFLLLAGVLPGQTQDLPIAPYLPAMGKNLVGKSPITVQYPYENMPVARGAKNIYLFGKIHLPQATLNIDGQSVPVQENGTFIAFLPVEPGNYSFLLTAQSGGQVYQAVRHVSIPGIPLEQLVEKAQFENTQLFPSSPVWVLPGDTLHLAAVGTPGARVTASLGGLKGGKNISLTEAPVNSGQYQASFIVSAQEKPQTVKVQYVLQDPVTKTRAKTSAKQTVKVLNPKAPAQWAKVIDPGVKLRQLPVTQGSLYPFYRAYGEVLITGRENGLYRLRLSDTETAWLEEKKLRFVSPEAETNQIQNVQTTSTEAATYVRWQGTKQVPLAIEEFNNRLEISFYYTDRFEENFNFDATSPLLDHIEWKMPQKNVLQLALYFKEGQPLWGYTYQYHDNDLVLQLHHTPQIHPKKNKPLAGARILIDAGHSPKRTPPYDGLVSPSGFLEYEANLALAEAVKSKLEKAGATVIMTRQADNYMSLPDRYEKAVAENAHIFVSLHHNALPETTNPLAIPRGYSVYYTYPHSFALAQAVYQAFNQKISLPDSGLIANDVLFIPRISDMPSILIENAYMILPEQEALVMSPAGKELFAQTIYEGILNFYKNQDASRAAASVTSR